MVIISIEIYLSSPLAGLVSNVIIVVWLRFVNDYIVIAIVIIIRLIISISISISIISMIRNCNHNGENINYNP